MKIALALLLALTLGLMPLVADADDFQSNGAPAAAPAGPKPVTRSRHVEPSETPPETATAPAPPAAASGGFDGAWVATLNCLAAASGPAFETPIPVRVASGSLQGTAGGMTLKGTVGADGSFTGNASGAADSYTFIGRLVGTRGLAKRLGGRDCTFTFAKQ